MEMKILVLNGSPHPQGSTKDMVNAFKKGAESAGHIVDVVDVCKKKIGGCLVNLFLCPDGALYRNCKGDAPTIL